MSSVKPSTWDEFLCGPVYVINMDKSKHRLELAKTRIREAGFENIQRLPAIDATDNTILKQEWDSYGAPRFDLQRDPEFMKYTGKQGCFLSHVKLWREMIQNQIPWAIVFEDDIMFHPKWKEISAYYFRNTPHDWEMLYMGCQMDFESEYHIEQGPVYCTHAMVITLACAKALYDTLASYGRQHGVYTIDNMFHDMQKENKFPVPYYLWNSRMFPCNQAHMNKGWSRRNHGLVFQDESLGSYIKEHY